MSGNSLPQGVASRAENPCSPAYELDDNEQAQRGYDVGPANGIMGPQTAAGLKRFQADRGMTPDGIINSELLARLRA